MIDTLLYVSRNNTAAHSDNALMELVDQLLVVSNNQDRRSLLVDLDRKSVV